MSSEIPSPSVSTDLGLRPRAIIARTLVVVSVVLAFGLLYLFRNVLFCLLIGIVVSTAVEPLAVRLAGTRLKQSHAIVLVYVALAAVCAALLIWGLPLVFEQTVTLIETLPRAYEELRSQLTSTPLSTINSLAARLPEKWPPIRLDDSAAAEVIASLRGDSASIGWFPKSVLLMVAVLLFAFYWSLQGPRTITALVLRIPEERRIAVREFLDAVLDRVGAFVRGQGLLCLAIAVLSFIAYWWIGLPYPLVLAAIAGMLELVPYFGPTLGTIPAFMAALSTDPSKGVWVIVAAAAIQILENYLIVPRIMDRAVGVNPVVTLLAIVAFGSLFGTMGVILAIPMAAIVQLAMERVLLQPELNDPPAPVARDSVSRLRYEVNELIQDVRVQFRQKDEPATDGADEVEDLVEALAIDFEHELALLEAPAADDAQPQPNGRVSP